MRSTEPVLNGKLVARGLAREYIVNFMGLTIEQRSHTDVQILAVVLLVAEQEHAGRVLRLSGDVGSVPGDGSVRTRDPDLARGWRGDLGGPDDEGHRVDTGLERRRADHRGGGDGDGEGGEGGGE